MISLVSKAKLLEHEVRIGLKRAFPNHLVYRESDFPVSWIGPQSPIKFKRSQAVDFLILGRTFNLAIEVKYTQQATFAFQNIRDTQMEFLAVFQEKAGNSYIVIGIEKPELTINLISFPDFLSLRATIQKESINFLADLRVYGHFFTRLPRVQMRKNYFVDFTPLSNRTLD